MVYLSAQVLSVEKAPRKTQVFLISLAPLVTLARYEGIFLILVVCFLFLLKKRVLNAFSFGGLGLLPIAIYGLISMSKGWYFLPNPVLVKGDVPDLSTLFSLSGGIRFLGFAASRGYHQILINPHMLLLILAALVVFVWQYGKRKVSRADIPIMLGISIGTGLLHMFFARVEMFLRYEAYLVVLCIFAIVVGLAEYFSKRPILVLSRRNVPKYLAQTVIFFMALLPFDIRARGSLKLLPQATANIYQQQYQMGLFLKEFYQGKGVAANDIGAINYLADIQCVDLRGLADVEPVRLRREGRYDRGQIFSLTERENVRIAIVYDQWYGRFGGLPEQWRKVGKWRISDNVVCADEEVTFYAVHPLEAAKLNRNLRDFSPRLPKGIMQIIAKFGEGAK
jgi:hypothetical protein